MKHGGRKRGVPNRITSDLRQLLSDAANEYLQRDLKALQPAKRAELIVRMLPYILPPATFATDAEAMQNIEPLTLILTRDTCSRCSDAASEAE
jgi:hypothetical protein